MNTDIKYTKSVVLEAVKDGDVLIISEIDAVINNEADKRPRLDNTYVEFHVFIKALDFLTDGCRITTVCDEFSANNILRRG